ncbi:hypothetical protein PLICRDRAFT_180298 [Plicaturopsis crispa FD-325 SS-3]|uniref:Cyclin N-terminal domain-containing protein n=1 Tax=Plicaturopsis crispa FD-325 SS-3 TaxID=944288 RepID=A0A0C9SW58_PLICR|nr:hypothetical protein PLICRDRAFT_180298 [Plicaturopsis crispa FD-325 SS-3]
MSGTAPVLTSATHSKLTPFIAYALHRTKLGVRHGCLSTHRYHSFPPSTPRTAPPRRMAAVHGHSNSQNHPDPFRTQNHNISRSRSQFSSTSVPAGGPSARIHTSSPFLHVVVVDADHSQSLHPRRHRSRHSTDLFYGHKRIARLCARFITHFFASPENVPVPATASHSKLFLFIAYALHRTKLKECVTHALLVLLQRLKARFPTVRGPSGHRLSICVSMIASKVMCDDTYSNKSWSMVAQKMFALREIN